MQRFLTFIFIISVAITVFAQYDDDDNRPRKSYPGGKCYMMRFQLADKGSNQCSLDKPEEYLSAKAIARRQRQGLRIDSTDLPISDVYLQQLLVKGTSIVSKSKWNNSVVVLSKSLRDLKTLAHLPFVKDSRLVWRSPDSISSGPVRVSMRPSFSGWEDEADTKYGVTYDQIHMLHGEALLDGTSLGQGMTIAVLDGGFMNVDAIEAFKRVNICGTADMVYPPSKDIYKEVDHGTKVLSTMAIAQSSRFMGTAPMASYWLIRCEDHDTEQLVEEDYWAAAAEFADSVGVDIITSSLGYNVFDHQDMNHRYIDLDGHRSICSHAASMLAGKGIILVVSAGNDGMGSWKKIEVPADAEHIITVGAETPEGLNAPFSSIGPTADGRIKPDVLALGSPATVVSGRGTIMKDTGTSFSTPQVAGLVACLWQTVPTATALDVIDAVIKSADNLYPDNIYGYGTPDFSKAVKLLKKIRNKE